MIRRTLIRDLANRSRIVVHLELRESSDPGTLSPAFSVTAETYEAHGTHSGRLSHSHRREPDSSGCDHDAAFTAFPELAPLVALHLADSTTGEPMHAEANGLYFYRTARSLPGGWTDDYGQADREGLTIQQYAQRAACHCLRVQSIPLDHVDEQELPAAFHEFVEQQRDRWQHEATTGRAQLQAIPTIDELRGYDVRGYRVKQRSYPNCSELVGPGGTRRTAPKGRDYTSTERAVLSSRYPMFEEMENRAKRDHNEATFGLPSVLDHTPSLDHPCPRCYELARRGDQAP